MESDDLTLHTFADVVADYRLKYSRHHREQMNWFGAPHLTIEEAIRRACKSEIPKKNGGGLVRHSHQSAYRIPAIALSEAAERLELHKSDVEKAADFATLLAVVEASVKSIRRIGPLAAYDISLRIGAYRRLHPAEIYLHTGTLDGAKALGLPTNVKSLPMSSLPSGLRSLSAEEAEDVLCIYRRALARIRQGGTGPAPTRSVCFPTAGRRSARRTGRSGCF
jgi:hypothetical protein